MSDFLLLAGLVVILLAGSALCSGVEAALLTVSPLRVHDMARARHGRGPAAGCSCLKGRLARVLVMLVITNNLFNIFGSLMLGALAAVVFNHHELQGTALTVFSISFTALVIVLGEIVPKAFGTRTAASMALLAAPALALLLKLGTPLVLLLERLMPALSEETNSPPMKARSACSPGWDHQKGDIEADEAAMIAKVFQLNDLTARDLMLPRVSAPTLNGSTRLDELRDLLLSDDSSPGGWCWGRKSMRCWGWPAAINCSPPWCRAGASPAPPASRSRWSSCLR